jgi:uncharacterized protein YrzB (UPF0473 family)
MTNENILFGHDHGDCCGDDKESDCSHCDCGCDSECEDPECSCGDQADGMNGETTITMTDAEGNEYEFMLYDEIDYKDESYLLLITSDEEEPELVIVKVVPGEDGNDALMSVDEEEYDRVFAEYERICEEEEDDEDDDSNEEA